MYSHYVTENIQLTTYQIIFKVAIFGRKTNFLKFENLLHLQIGVSGDFLDLIFTL